MLDIERYSTIKSGFGHGVSDHLIIEVADRLKQAATVSTISARIGDNIFAILWPSLDDLDNICTNVKDILQALEPPFQLDEIIVSSRTYTGIALSNLHYSQPKAVFQAADTALQIAKQRKSKDLVIFDSHMQESVVQHLNLEVELQKTIKAKQLSLHYQPIFQLDTYKIVSFEALARWQHPTYGQVSPARFIPLAEETGLIIPLGEWVLSEACRQLSRWQTQYGAASPTSISINLSSIQLQSPTLLQCIDSSLRDTGLAGSALKLEITESTLMENINEAMDLLTQLRARGIRLSIDDFGTGYSSLSYLRLLPIDALKIDRTFIKDIEMNPTNFDITSTIINLATHLGLEVVAEGLEKQEHLAILRSLSCKYGQGYVFSPPLGVTAATELIETKLDS